MSFNQRSGFFAIARPASLGEYHDEYLHTAEGWRISRRVAKADFRRAAA